MPETELQKSSVIPHCQNRGLSCLKQICQLQTLAYGGLTFFAAAYLKIVYKMKINVMILQKKLLYSHHIPAPV